MASVAKWFRVNFKGLQQNDCDVRKLSESFQEIWDVLKNAFRFLAENKI